MRTRLYVVVAPYSLLMILGRVLLGVRGGGGGGR